MIAVIFEAKPADGRREKYFDIASQLKPFLSEIEGFISVERFQSLTDPEKILSLSFFENEEAVKRWRNLEAHRVAQKKGRESIFNDYRIRIAQVIRDYSKTDREQSPKHDTTEAKA